MDDPAPPRKILVIALAACAAALILLEADLASVLDRFYEQQGESKFLAVWGRRAAQVSYAKCREDPVACLGKRVSWPVWHLAKGVSYIDDPSQPVVWSNEEQVPINQARSGPTAAVSEVRVIHPDSIELIFLGSPQAVYGGATRKE